MGFYISTVGNSQHALTYSNLSQTSCAPVDQHRYRGMQSVQLHSWPEKKLSLIRITVDAPEVTMGESYNNFAALTTASYLFTSGAASGDAL